MNLAICLVLLALTILSGDSQINIGFKGISLLTNLEAAGFISNYASKDYKKLSNKITQEELEFVFKSSEKSLKKRKTLEETLAFNGRVIKTNQRETDPSLNRDRESDPFIRKREMLNLVFEEATGELSRRHNLSPDDISDCLPRFPLNGPVGKASRNACKQDIQPKGFCDSNRKYRTADGQCNNLKNPDWGSAMVCQRRVLRANYVGNSGFRVAVSGDPLPAPRELSLNLHNHLNRPTNYVTHMYMFFGQLLDHDIALTPVSTTVDNQAIKCCPPEKRTHPQCAPILVDRNDPFYSKFGVTCLNFVRSAICPTCTLGYRIQMNQVTSFIDASFVYGNSQTKTVSLRTKDGTGRLRVQINDNEVLLPRSSDPQADQCSFPETNDICFETGDPRANQHTVLASLHTAFMREHNRLADGLRSVNPQWNDERIFQEARRILGAQMQVITYKEYLPITLGRDRMSYFRLWVSDSETTSYNLQEDPTMILEFSTAAFRFGHSLINSLVTSTPLNATYGHRLLRNEFFQPFDLYNNGIIGQLVRGASNSPSQWSDTHLVPDVTNYLYRIRGDQTGLDLAATNINRGRDHGIPRYVDMVRYCSKGEVVIKSFSDLVSYQLMRYQQSDALRRNYQNVADVDLWTAILMEIPNNGAVVGPTAACIIGLQFERLKFGDRFYFEHWGQAGSFTYRQMQELRKSSLSMILCFNTDASTMPLNAMLFKSRNNPGIDCKDFMGINLSYWRE